MSIQMQMKWDEKMHLTATSAGNTVSADAKAPLGTGTAMTPKELVVAGLCGCTAMDVVALMKKHKQEVLSFEVSADVATTDTHPMVFSKAELLFKLNGKLDVAKVVEAVQLSQTKYCGVTAMLLKAFPITYKVIVNGEEVAQGEAKF
jgi:putative redox protein